VHGLSFTIHIYVPFLPDYVQSKKEMAGLCYMYVHIFSNTFAAVERNVALGWSSAHYDQVVSEDVFPMPLILKKFLLHISCVLVAMRWPTCFAHWLVQFHRLISWTHMKQCYRWARRPWVGSSCFGNLGMQGPKKQSKSMYMLLVDQMCLSDCMMKWTKSWGLYI
jgi:hypothetical protein